MAPIRQLARIAREEAGTILVFWALMLAVLMGLVALSFDIGRIASTQSELQSFADSVALAAAGELDGSGEAIVRARRAARDLVTRGQTFAEGERVLSEADYEPLTFYETLPPDDRTAMGTPTNDPARARYVRAVVTPRDVGTPFAAALRVLTGAAAGGPAQVGAEAVAGFTMYACDITPLMFCVPGGWKADANVGQMILLRSGGGGSLWGPGNFGFLKPDENSIDPNGPCAGLNGAQLDGCLVSAEGSITQCFSQNGVDTEPGQKVGIKDALFNVRFDIYQATMNNKRNSPIYRPAPNVVKGIVPKGGGQCIGNNADPSPDTMALPRDTAFTNRFGNGEWDDAAYVALNHGGADPRASHDADSMGLKPSLAGTRYELYHAEIAAANGGNILTGKAETGIAQCAPAASPDPARRVLIAAAVDCDANPVSGRETGVPVQEFVRIFMTEPVGNSGSNSVDIFVEVLGSAGGAGGGGGPEGKFHEVVQLYR